MLTWASMPRYGFNFLWGFDQGPDPAKRPTMAPADLKELDLVKDMGLDFVRIPLDYRFWTKNFDYDHPDEKALSTLDSYLEACRQRGLHMCLNLHRAPGFCINRLEDERDRLWRDPVAQDAFVSQWEMFARRYLGITNEFISFDLVNEPSGSVWGAPRESDPDRQAHERVMRRTVAAIRQIDPKREVVLDGWDGGHEALPELADLAVVQSGRGYQPFSLSHYHAPWVPHEMTVPEPIYPGTISNNKRWDKETLRGYYQPWRDVEAKGVKVHIGEFGCFNKTPNDVALRWFADLLSLFREYRWGYSLWNFNGPFGIVNHGRPGTTYEDWHGYKVDRALLDLYLQNRV
jgi:endoglucanase